MAFVVFGQKLDALVLFVFYLLSLVRCSAPLLQS